MRVNPTLILEGDVFEDDGGERQGDRLPKRPCQPGECRGFSGDGKRVVTASSDDTTRIWDAESGREIAVLKGARITPPAPIRPAISISTIVIDC